MVSAFDYLLLLGLNILVILVIAALRVFVGVAGAAFAFRTLFFLVLLSLKGRIFALLFDLPVVELYTAAVFRLILFLHLNRNLTFKLTTGHTQLMKFFLIVLTFQISLITFK